TNRCGLCCTKGANCGCCACCLANCWVFCPSPAKCKHIALSAALFVLASGALVYTSTASSVVLWRNKQQTALVSPYVFLDTAIAIDTLAYCFLIAAMQGAQLLERVISR